MKKSSCFLLLLILCLLLSACGGETPAAAKPQASDAFPGGTGTEADPYLIRSAEDLLFMAACVNGSDDYNNPYLSAFYRLEADVDLGGADWTPLRELRGGFDGAGHSVSGFSVRESADRTEYGFFGRVSGRVENLTVSRAEIRVESDRAPEAGAIAGNVFGGRLSGCRTTDTVSVFCNYKAGGIAGSVSAGTEEDDGFLIRDCVNEARVESSGSVGSAAGIAPYLHGNVSGCVNRGSIVSAGDAGGIACSLAGYAQQCENEGDVQADDYAGGICTNFGDGALNSSSNDAGVGLVGCVNRGSVSSASRIAAGICGRISTGAVRDCRNSGAVSSAQEAGGIFGYFQVSAFGTAAAEVLIADCVNSGSVDSAEGFIYAVGGIGGDAALSGAHLRLENCENSGDVTSLKGKYVGGILGRASASEQEGGTVSFVNCRNSGEVRGAKHVGGILGCGSAGSLEVALPLTLHAEGCRNTGTVVGLQNGCCVGGITGGGSGEVIRDFSDCGSEAELRAEAARFYTDELWPEQPEE